VLGDWGKESICASIFQLMSMFRDESGYAHPLLHAIYEGKGGMV